MRLFVKAAGSPRRSRRPFSFAASLVAVALLAAAPAAADIYRYVDRDGVIHYTDDPAKVPAEYESVVQHKTVPRSTEAPAMAASEETEAQEPSSEETEAQEPSSEETEAQEPSSEETEAGETGAPEPVEPPSETDEVGSDTEEGSQNQEGDNSVENEAGVGEEGGDASGQIDENPATGEPSAPATEDSSETGDGSGEVSSQRQQLIEEARALRQRQAELLNDKTYQRRKNKRRYQNRPHIQELTAEEARIEERLQEIENALR